MYRTILAAALIATGIVSTSIAASAHGYAGDSRHRSIHHSRGPVVVVPARPRVVVVPARPRVVVVPKRPRFVVMPRHRHAEHRMWRNGRWFVR